MAGIVMIVVIVVLLLWLGFGYVGFRVAICRGHELDINNRDALKGSSWDLYYEEIQEGISWIKSQKTEDVEIESVDGLKLCGRLIENPDAKGTVLMFHGYRTHPEVDFSASSHVYYESGNNILLIDQRASGKSKGKYIGFGVLESRDCKRWAEYIADRFGPEKEIILAGLSMGASTVLMAAGLDLPDNVSGIVADSAFSSPAEIIRKKIHQSYHCNGKLLTVAIGFWSRLLAGYSLKECSVLDAMRGNNIPVFFIHGKVDSLVPVEMTVQAAEVCNAPKEVLLVENAEHGTGYLVENRVYEKMLREFCS